MADLGRIRPTGAGAARGGSRLASCLALTGALALAGHAGLVLAQGTAEPAEQATGEQANGQQATATEEAAPVIPPLPTTIDQTVPADPALDPAADTTLGEGAVPPVAETAGQVADAPAGQEPAGQEAVEPPLVEPIDPVGGTQVFSRTLAPATQIQDRLARAGIRPGAATAAGPQAPPAGPVLTLNLGIGLVVEDGDLANRNSFGASYRSETREQLLELSLGTSFDVDADGFNSDDTFPDADLAYIRDTGVMLLRLSASYSVADVNGTIPGPDFLFDESDIVRDDGTRSTTRLGLGFDVNRRGAIGLEFDSTYQARDYSDTADPDLTDTRNLTYQGALRLNLSPTLTFRLTALKSDIEKGGDTDVNELETAYGGRVTWQVTPGTGLDLSLARSRVETDENETIDVIDPETGLLVDRIPTGARLSSVQTGLVGDLALTRQLGNGTVGLSLGRELTSTGDIDRLAVSRRLSLAGGADLRLSFGVARFEESDSIPTLALRYSQPLPEGQITASLESDGFVDNDNQNVTRTRATLGYGRPLTPLSDLSVSLGLASIDVVDGLEADTVAADLLLGYSRQLDRNWFLNLGYEGTLSRKDGEDDDRDSTIFVNLNRSFSIRP